MSGSPRVEDRGRTTCSLEGLPGAGRCSSGSEDAPPPPLKVEEDFSEEQWRLLRIRSRLADVKAVCLNHERRYLSLFESSQKYCADPLGIHPASGRKRKASKRVTLDRYAQMCEKYPALLPGHKLCAGCSISLSREAKEALVEGGAGSHDDVGADRRGSRDGASEDVAPPEGVGAPQQPAAAHALRAAGAPRGAGRVRGQDGARARALRRPAAAPRARAAGPGPAGTPRAGSARLARRARQARHASASAGAGVSRF